MNLPASARDAGSASGSGRSPGVGNGNQPTPVFLSEKSHGHRSLGGGGGAYCPWGRKELHTTEHLMQCFLLMQEEEVTTHSSIVAWRIPGTEEPGGLQSLGVKKDSEPTE